MRRRHIAAATAVTALGFAAAHHAPTQRPGLHAQPVKPRKHSTATGQEARFLAASRPDATPASRDLERTPRPKPTETRGSSPRPAFRSGDPTAAQWAELRQCEASGDYTLHDPPYYGAYQFNLGTWASVGGEGNPADAPPAEQDARALALWRDRGWQPWPVCGYAKWGAR